MFKMFKLIHPEKEFAKKFEIVLIRENSRRLQLLFGFVGISQIVLSHCRGCRRIALADRYIYLSAFTYRVLCFIYWLDAVCKQNRFIRKVDHTSSCNDIRRTIIVDDDRLLFYRLYV